MASVSLMSWAVSDAVQKYGVLLHHSIWRHKCMTSCVGSSGWHEFGQDVGKVPFIIGVHYHLPVAILDIQLGEED